MDINLMNVEALSHLLVPVNDCVISPRRLYIRIWNEELLRWKCWMLSSVINHFHPKSIPEASYT